MPIPRDSIDLRAGPARDDVRATLERMLVSGELAPGARLVDAELLGLTHSSRAPLREALNELALVRLVSIEPRQSTYVTPLDPDVARKSLEIEGAVMRQVIVEAVPVLDEADKDALVAQAERIFATPEALRAGIVARDHRVLLSVFVERAGNPEYARVLANVSPVVDRYAALSIATLADEHRPRFRAVIDAALAGDAETAADAWDAFSSQLHPNEAYRTADAAPTPTTTLRDKAAAVIEHEIFAGTLEPGEVLREAELMRWLNVSRTPVREALTALAHRGLVDLSHQRSARVARLDANATGHVLRALAVLRALEVRLALERSGDQVAARLGEARPAWERAADADAVIRAAVDLVAPLDALCGNDILVQLASAFSGRIAWSARHDPESAVRASRDALLAVHGALVARDLSAATSAVWRLYAGTAHGSAEHNPAPASGN